MTLTLLWYSSSSWAGAHLVRGERGAKEVKHADEGQAEAGGQRKQQPRLMKAPPRFIKLLTVLERT